MRQLILISGFMLVFAPLFAQPWTGSQPLDIHVNANTPAYLGLLIQGNTGAIGGLGVEGNATGTVYTLAATVDNNMIMGVMNSNGTGPSALNIDWQNHVGINTMDTKGYAFAVAGAAIFTEAVVKLQANWPDYVFRKNYQLPSLDSVAAYIRLNSHLPGMPTSAQVEKNGIDLGATEAKLLEKVEQLTLYTIELQKQVDSLKTEVQRLNCTRK
ncbi:hypothetical protein [Puia dinghuensis]|uniref:BZIP transcription factor n=1 Tax=Puia dinghuensis TaxID=1792502 RepID=A0A8J2XUB1_9BACT|nr:hypothetical protein [Puia dinghuensis]GGB06427.1 hypothetical protein GCM10011511_32320 [Puia dinghuensis]